jgi:hypothetical protein
MSTFGSALLKPAPNHCFSHICAFVFFLICSIADANDPAVKYLEMLEGSLVWEARSLFFVAVGAPATVIYQPAGLVIAGLGILVVAVMVLPFVLLVDILHS